jgi:hypothetical protein
MESTVIGVVRAMILTGSRNHPSSKAISAELRATTLSWAVYGAAKEWLETPERCTSEEISETIAHLVSPILS